jgi:hypothetical protein
MSDDPIPLLEEDARRQVRLGISHLSDAERTFIGTAAWARTARGWKVQGHLEGVAFHVDTIPNDSWGSIFITRKTKMADKGGIWVDPIPPTDPDEWQAWRATLVRALTLIEAVISARERHGHPCPNASVAAGALRKEIG